MARVKTFDSEAAIDAAMDLFWRKGYADTSVQDLVNELGISRSSLYATFGDKDQLFQQVFSRYTATEAGPRHGLLTRDGSVLDALRELLYGLAQAPEHYPDRRGCLVVNAAMERVPYDPATTALVTAQLGRLEEALYAALRRGQVAGDIDPDRDARTMARFLVSVIQGMRVVGKATADRTTLRDTADVALDAVRAPRSGAEGRHQDSTAR